MFNIESVSKMIGLEAVTPSGKYKIVGIYDNSNGLYFVLYDGKDTILYNTASNPLPIVSTETLIEITPEKFIEEQKEEFKDCLILYKNNILYMKNIFDKPYKLSYIYTKDNIYKFDTELNILYDPDKEKFIYKNELYELDMNDENYHILISNIKKEYIKLCKKFLDTNLNGEQLKQFMKEFVFCCEYSKEEQ